ncbi:MAG: hypothetical protein AAF871_02795 [Pseudomonadota bacterium]
MARPGPPVYLERRGYRRRRLVDVGRVLPVIGAVLFLLPMLWAGSMGTGAGLIYLFTIWGLLIVAVFVFATVVGRPDPAAGQNDDMADQPAPANAPDPPAGDGGPGTN